MCGSLKPPESDQHWKVRLHGAFSIPHEALGLRPKRSKLPPRDMASPRIRRLAQRSITSRRTRTTNSLERTSCGVPLRPAEKTHQRYHERPFALFVTLRPVARVQQNYAERVHVHQVILMTDPFISTHASVLFFSALVLFHLIIRIACTSTMTISTRRLKKSVRTLFSLEKYSRGIIFS